MARPAFPAPFVRAVSTKLAPIMRRDREAVPWHGGLFDLVKPIYEAVLMHGLVYPPPCPSPTRGTDGARVTTRGVPIFFLPNAARDLPVNAASTSATM